MREPNGKLRYNCTLIDLYDRYIVSSMNGSYINSRLAIETLQKALLKENYPKGLILHSNQGGQYSWWEFTMFCNNHGLRQSMSKAGCPYDNAPMERYYNTFKNSFYYINCFESIKAMDDATDRYVNYYNYVRPHSYNDYLTPMEARMK
jgi:Transposase and inactivated derivatives